ncbi:MAG: hypothetical protein Q9183_004626 [Haloplaca sp. 2 TL-2023]
MSKSRIRISCGNQALKNYLTIEAPSHTADWSNYLDTLSVDMNQMQLSSASIPVNAVVGWSMYVPSLQIGGLIVPPYRRQGGIFPRWHIKVEFRAVAPLRPKVGRWYWENPSFVWRPIGDWRVPVWQREYSGLRVPPIVGVKVSLVRGGVLPSS